MQQTLSILKTLADPTRLRLVVLLARGELTVSEIVSVLGQSQPRVSRHLKLLCDAGLLTRFQEGTWVFYRLAPSASSQEILGSVMKALDISDRDLTADQKGLEAIRARRTEEAQAYFRKNAKSWDAIRSLHVPDVDVEAALLEMAGDVEGQTLLDIGTGTGRVLELFAANIARGVGIDLSRDMLALARSALLAQDFSHCEVRQGDMYALGIDDSAIDIVVIHQVLHFADDPGQVLTEASRVVRPGGKVLIVDFSPHNREDLRETHQHRRLGFSDLEMATWAKGVGLSPVQTHHMEGGDLVVTLWRFDKTGDAQCAPAHKRAQA